MLSLRRWLSIILIVALLGGVFLIYNINEARMAIAPVKNSGDAEREFTETRQISGGDKPQVFLLGDSGDGIYGEIYGNIKQFCRDIHLKVIEGERFDAGSVTEKDLVIFSGVSISRYADLAELGKFIADGGRVIFAAGLAEGNGDSELWGALGIRKKGGGRDYKDLLFKEPLLPLQPDEMTYGGISRSLQIEVSDDASVYITDEETEVPIFYTYDCRKGKIALINGDFLKEIQYMGLLSGAIGALLEDFIYPVLGIKMAFLDNFPTASSVDNELCMKIYGYSAEGFIKDVVWPAFQGMLLRTNTPYTAIQPYSSGEGVLNADDNLSAAVCKSVVQFGGELVYSGDERLLRDESLAAFPWVTEGNSMTDGNLFAVCSSLGAYGIVSHVFDVGALIAKDGSSASWDLDKEQIGAFESDVLSRAPWLEGRTLSQTGYDLKSYKEMDYSWVKNADRIELTCSAAAKNQAFFYHTDKRIVKVEGLACNDVGNGYYLLRIQGNRGVIMLEEEK